MCFTGLTLPALGSKKPQALSNGLSEKEAPAAEEEESLSQDEPASPPSAQTEQQDGGNPLASLLGYRCASYQDPAPKCHYFPWPIWLKAHHNTGGQDFLLIRTTVALYSGDDGSGSEAGDATPERELPDDQLEPKPASEDNDNDIDAEV